MNRRTILSAALAAALLPLSATAQDSEVHPEGLHVHDAYLRTMGRPGSSGAAFMILHNNAATDDRLTAVASDAAERVELHTHVEQDGAMRMMQIEGGIPLPAGATHALERGGDHVMFLGLTRALAAGDVVTLRLLFESGTELTVEVPVDNDRPEGAGMGHGTGHGTGHGMATGG